MQIALIRIAYWGSKQRLGKDDQIGCRGLGDVWENDLPGRCTHGPSSYLDAANDHVGFVRKQGRKGEDQREGILGQPARTRRRVFSTGALGGLLSTDSTTSDYLRC